MTRQVCIFFLSLAVLLGALALLAYATPQEQSPDSFSVLVLRPGEGNAVIVNCGGQTLLLPVGDDEDMDDLMRYRNRHRSLQPDHVSMAKREAVSLGGAVCEIEQTGPDAWLLTVALAENRLRLRLSQTELPELSLNDEPSTVLETDRHSVRIFADGSRVAIRPDFSAWDD